MIRSIDTTIVLRLKSHKIVKTDYSDGLSDAGFKRSRSSVFKR